jgi:hypothetical protein
VCPWKVNVLRAGGEEGEWADEPTIDDASRRAIQSWLTAVIQSEHVSLLIGSGLSIALAREVGADGVEMVERQFTSPHADRVSDAAARSAVASGRNAPNIEDQIRTAIQLIAGLRILGDSDAERWEQEINDVLRSFAGAILEMERAVSDAVGANTAAGARARTLLTAFLLAFASRPASRERLHIFTTNYDRLVEYGCDQIGIRMIDRFVGSLEPVFRSSRIDLDLHYNPPGIRGEPRHLEGVVRFSKLHGSLDWRSKERRIVREGLPVGAGSDHPVLRSDPLQALMIYPNPAKDVETLEYPYAELFRDFSAATCRPNSTLVTYGYGFGDDHINRTIADMLTLPTTHVVIISFSDPDGRIESFVVRAARPAQISLLIGPHFGALENLAESYLPRPSIDVIEARRAALAGATGTPTGDASATPADDDDAED